MFTQLANDRRCHVQRLQYRHGPYMDAKSRLLAVEQPDLFEARVLKGNTLLGSTPPSLTPPECGLYRSFMQVALRQPKHALRVGEPL